MAELGQMRRIEEFFQNSCSFSACVSSNLTPRNGETMSRKIENEEIIEWAELFSSTSSEKKRKLFKRIARFATKPKRSRVSINLNRLDKYANASENIVVPGKVLGVGKVTKSFNISALDYSSEAAKKLAASKCKMVSIKEMAEKPDIKLII